MPELGGDEAVAKKATYLRSFEKAGAEASWRFLTGEAAELNKLTDAVGFRYSRSEDATGGVQFAHDSALIVLTGDGRISKYLHRRAPGSDAVAYKAYEEPTVRYALIEAAEGRIGSLGERLWVSICGYDPKRGEYVMLAQTVMALGGGATLVGVSVILGLFWWIERKKRAGQDHA